MTTDTQHLSPMEERVLALAALVQAALLVENSAFGKDTPDAALSVLYQSLYTTNPKDFSEIVPDLDALSLGITFCAMYCKSSQMMLKTEPSAMC